MTNYDFSVLNDKEFEEFVCDILSAEFKLNFQHFKRGKDKGVDIRYSSSRKNNHIVVQAKHYLNTPVSLLIKKLQKEESLKVRSLSPDEYWFVTSLPLSASNKDKIFETFTPYIQSPNFIFGREDLNRLLYSHKKVEKKWYKLWLSSTNILKTILNNAVEGRSEFYKEKILKKISLYVQNDTLNQALKIINRYNFILITGQPGVGKTTLANLLAYKFLAQNFELYYIDKDISEAEKVFSNDPQSQQIFFLDDFLGANYFEIINPKITESSIVNFIDRIRGTHNKYLILTTRTTILNQAKNSYEHLNRQNLDIARKELELKDYNIESKARILYNHLYHNTPIKYRKKIFSNQFYWHIINHPNYNPRLIEFFTTEYNLKGIKDSEYLDFVIECLNNPSEVWKYSYTKQLNDENRFLISTCLSLSDFSFDGVSQSMLERAFIKRIKYEIKENGYNKKHDSFNTALKELLDGYFSSKRINNKKVVVDFLNPSIKDFLIDHFRNSKEERIPIIGSAVYLEQVSFYVNELIENSDDIKTEVNDIFTKILSNEEVYECAEEYPSNSLEEKETYKSSYVIRIYFTLFEYSNQKEIEKAIYRLLNSVKFNKLNFKAKDNLLNVIKEIKPDSRIGRYVVSKWDTIINGFFEACYTEEDFDELLDLFSLYEISYRDYIKNVNNRMDVESAINSFLEDDLFQMIYEGKSNVKTQRDIDYLIKEVQKRKNDVLRKYHLLASWVPDIIWDIDGLHDLNLKEIKLENSLNQKRQNQLKNERILPAKTVENGDFNVDDLFSES